MKPVMTPERSRNQAENIGEYKAGAVVLRSYPLVLILELTQNCNLSCPMCRQGSGYRREWDMDASTFEMLARELFAKAMLIDLRGFGESLLVRDLPKYVRIAADSGARLRLVTNGQVNRGDVWEQLMAAHAAIAISCDAADDQLFERLRHGGTITRLAKTAQTINHFRDHYRVSADLVSLLTVVSRENLHDLANVVTMAARLRIAKVSLFPIQVPLWDSRHLSGDVAGLSRALEEARREADRLGVELHVGAALDVAIALTEHVKTHCMHPWAFAYISHDGGVGFCDQLIGNRKYILGSLTDAAFPAIWNNEAFQRLRQAHVNRHLSDEFAACRWCYRQRYVEFEHWVYPEMAAHYVSNTTQPALIRHGSCEQERLSFLE